jgi:CheY-like chemotaxis protein
MNSIQTQRPDLILAIDDDKKTLESVRRLLESEGFVVHTSASPVEGIKSYETHLAEIKLVLLDYVMHIMNGDEVFERLQQINPEVRVLLVTGSEEGVAERMLGRGLRGVLRKPFSPEDLLGRVRDELRGHGA